MEGKVPVSVIGNLVGHYFGNVREEVIVDATSLTDSAIVDLGAPLVVSTDPITGAEDYVAQLAVHINANDVRVAGGEPVAFLSVLLLTPSFPEDKLEHFFEHFNAGLSFENAQLIGGHSEYTSAVNKPVVIGTMIGKKVRDLNHNNIGSGQYVFLAGHLGQEGLMLLKGTYHEDILKVSIKPIMDVAFTVPSLVFAHDLTEGGLVAGLWELVRGTPFGIRATLDPVYIGDELRTLSHSMNFNPLKLISSGSVLLVCNKKDEIEKAFNEHHIPFAFLGTLDDTGEAFLNGIKVKDLDPEGPDELWSVKASSSVDK
ncbi:AIR synthase related protein [Coprothermobacter platensis]|uniref:AIR synthase related protein n=1 Tax=Coprothermobacter platensis TaxID=108819 RepID=UPI00035E54FB|nr:AIR synthase related protein [Coprothermobacter platensis]